MTPFLEQIYAAVTAEWKSAQQIANELPGRVSGFRITPRLRKMVEKGLVEIDTEAKWHRYRRTR